MMSEESATSWSPQSAATAIQREALTKSVEEVLPAEKGRFQWERKTRTKKKKKQGCVQLSGSSKDGRQSVKSAKCEAAGAVGKVVCLPF